MSLLRPCLDQRTLKFLLTAFEQKLTLKTRSCFAPLLNLSHMLITCLLKIVVVRADHQLQSRRTSFTLTLFYSRTFSVMTNIIIVIFRLHVHNIQLCTGEPKHVKLTHVGNSNLQSQYNNVQHYNNLASYVPLSL